MAEDTQNVKETISRSGNTIQKTTETSNLKDHNEHNNIVATRIVWYIAGVVLIILGLRFILTLLGANSANSFANFVYRVSHPFVVPFFSLFNYHTYNYSSSHFEVYTLVAMLVYILIAWGISKLITINER